MKIGIIGGGASGMAAAIAAAERGASVVVLEKNDRVGKKLLVTGNGKCNLSNMNLSCGCYHSDTPERLEPILSHFTVSDTLDFFHGLGLLTKEKNGGVYPECEQASAVLDVLRYAMERRKVTVRTGCRVVRAEKKDGRFFVDTQKEDRHAYYEFDKIILACGSCAGYQKQSDANGLKLADMLILKWIPFTPALVQLRCREAFFKSLAGVRCQAAVTLLTEGREIRETGELQLTDYGISGIPVFQLSRYAAKSFDSGSKELSVYLDFLPSYKERELCQMLKERKMALGGNESAERFFTGTVHKKIIGVLRKSCGISCAEAIGRISEEKLRLMCSLMKRFPVTVTGTNPFSQSQVCAGGVRLTQVTDCLEAKNQPGLYVTGELLDADGRCGGYNLQWAWTTGILAGRAASRR